MDRKQLKHFNRLLGAGLVGIYALTGAVYAGLSYYAKKTLPGKKSAK